MPKQKLDKEIRNAIKEAKQLIEEVARVDGNEAETRRRIERIFAAVMGYDVFKHITREHAVSGAGGKDYCDFAIQVEGTQPNKPVIMVEIKAVNIDLVPKHLKQISSYAINNGTEWVVLTNGKDWRLYHVSFGQPPQLKLMESWDLLKDEPVILAEKFSLISYKNVKKGVLDEIWRKANVLTPQNLIKILVAEDSIKMIRRELRKKTGVQVSPDEIIGAIRRILNEAALTEMCNTKISLPRTLAEPDIIENFWKSFIKFAESRNSMLKMTNPGSGIYLPIRIGKTGIFLQAVASTWNSEANSSGTNEIRAEVYLARNKSKERFAILEQSKDSIEADFGEQLIWHNPVELKNCRIYLRRTVNLKNTKEWPEYHLWLLGKLEKLNKVFSPRVKDL